MTTIYFIRHAEPDRSTGSDRDCTLTEKGRQDGKKVTEYLRDKKIDVLLSSPFTRAIETVKDFAHSAELPITTVEDFRERKVADEWIDDFETYAARQWSDFNFRLSGGESTKEVQERNVAALQKVLLQYADKNIAVATHGTALSTIINYFDPTYGFEDFMAMAYKMPWAAAMKFDGQDCVLIEKIDL